MSVIAEYKEILFNKEIGKNFQEFLNKSNLNTHYDVVRELFIITKEDFNKLAYNKLEKDFKLKYKKELREWI